MSAPHISKRASYTKPSSKETLKEFVFVAMIGVRSSHSDMNMVLAMLFAHDSSLRLALLRRQGFA
jgi:hypothetical protein